MAFHGEGPFQTVFALQAGGHWFESVPGCHFAQIAQLVEQRTENPRVAGSTPALGTICGHSSSGRAPPCQGGGSESEPRCPLHVQCPQFRVGIKSGKQKRVDFSCKIAYNNHAR